MGLMFQSFFQDGREARQLTLIQLGLVEGVFEEGQSLTVADHDWRPPMLWEVLMVD